MSAEIIANYIPLQKIKSGLVSQTSVSSLLPHQMAEVIDLLYRAWIALGFNSVCCLNNDSNISF